MARLDSRRSRLPRRNSCVPSRKRSRRRSVGSVPSTALAVRATAAASDVDAESQQLLGQLCVCGMNTATVEIRIGPVYTKICPQCFNTGIHALRLLSKLL
jgi:hypothetical protein